SQSRPRLAPRPGSTSDSPRARTRRAPAWSRGAPAGAVHSGGALERAVAEGGPHVAEAAGLAVAAALAAHEPFGVLRAAPGAHLEAALPRAATAAEIATGGARRAQLAGDPLAAQGG